MHPAFIHAIKRLKEHKEAPLIARVNDLDHFTVWAERLVEDFVSEVLDFDSEEDCEFFNTLFNEAAKPPSSVRPSREGQIMICEACKQAWTELREGK